MELRLFCVFGLNRCYITASQCDYIHIYSILVIGLQWRHNDRDGVSNNQRPDCLLNRLFSRRPVKAWKLRVTGLCEGNSPVTSEFPAQRTSSAENVSIWWRYHELCTGKAQFDKNYILNQFRLSQQNSLWFTTSLIKIDFNSAFPLLGTKVDSTNSANY